MSALLEFHDVSYTYPHQDQPAVRNLNFSINQGEFVGILGADDSGKTTITKLTNGILLPTKGEVVVAGIVMADDRETGYGFHQKVGVVFADPENQIVGTTVEEDVAFGLGNLCIPTNEMRKRVNFYLQRVGLRQYASRSPSELSGGEQQKLCIAGVLAMQPECLVLDQPLTFLDSRSRQEILDLLVELKTQGMTIVSLTSDPKEVVVADTIIVLHKGAIHTQCTPTTLWNHLTLLEPTGVVPSDLMIFRETLRKRGYSIQEHSLTPETITSDLIS